jgi:hypothetical protein
MRFFEVPLNGVRSVVSAYFEQGVRPLKQTHWADGQAVSRDERMTR